MLAGADYVMPHLQPMYVAAIMRRSSSRRYSRGQTTGAQAWPYVSNWLKRLAAAAPGKPIVAVQSGWASNNEEHDGAACVDISLASERAYFETLDDNCAQFKALKAGWMWHSASVDRAALLMWQRSPTSKPASVC